MTELDAHAIKILKGLSGRTSIIPQAAMHGKRCPHGVYKETCTVSLGLVLTETGVSDIVCSVMALATRMTFSCYSVSSANTILLVFFCFLL